MLANSSTEPTTVYPTPSGMPVSHSSGSQSVSSSARRRCTSYDPPDTWDVCNASKHGEGAHVTWRVYPSGFTATSSTGGDTTVICRVSRSDRGMGLAKSLALKTTWWGSARTSAQVGDHVKVPRPLPQYVKSAGWSTSVSAPPTAVMVTGWLSGSEASTSNVNSVPANTQVSAMGTTSGGWLAQSCTSIWMSRTTSPTLRSVPLTGRHSSMRMATLYSPTNCGVVQVRSPVSGSMVNSSSPGLTSSGKT